MVRSSIAVWAIFVFERVDACAGFLADIDAELKVLRAYYYYLAMDMYGNVPLVTIEETARRMAQLLRALVHGELVRNGRIDLFDGKHWSAIDPP